MILTGKSQYGLPDSFEVSNTSVGFFGVTRCGKTTQELKLFEAAKKDRNCLNIVFDIKGEFAEHFYALGDKVISLHQTKAHMEHWNFMRDIMFAEYPDTAAMELAESVFNEAVSQSSQPFIPKSARTVFEIYLRLMLRKYPKNSGKIPTNRQVINSLLSFDAEKLINECAPYPELDGIKPLLKGAMSTVGGIRAELNETLLETFRDDFKADGSFSICEYVRNCTGTLFLETSLNELQSSKNALRILIDLAIKEALSGKAKASRVIFFLDELPVLGHLQHLPILLNLGAGYRAYAVIGCQNISQLNAYGKDEAGMILSGMRTHIVFAANDNDTAEYFSARSGKKQRLITSVGLDRKPFNTLSDQPTITTHELLHGLSTGEAYCFAQDGSIKYIHFLKGN